MNTNKQTAYERDANGLCVVCAAKWPDRRRGLCARHYEQFRRSKNGLSEAEIEDLEALLVEQGRLMPSIQGKKAGHENVFADAVAAIKSKHAHAAENREPYAATHPTAAEVEKIVEEAKAHAKRLPAVADAKQVKDVKNRRKKAE